MIATTNAAATTGQKPIPIDEKKVVSGWSKRGEIWYIVPRSPLPG